MGVEYYLHKGGPVGWRGFFAFVAILGIAAYPLSHVSHAHASTYIPVEDDIYDILSRLDAEGLLPAALLTTRPLSRGEVIRLLEQVKRYAVGRGKHINALIELLANRLELDGSDLQIADKAYIKYIHTDLGSRSLDYNNSGDVYQNGANSRIGFDSRIEDLGRFSFYLSSEWSGDGGDVAFRYKRAYAVLNIKWDIIMGKDGMWWGPGYHGGLLLTDNVQPFKMLKVSNREPFILPWYFSYLGPFRLTFFAANLEKDRGDAARPYIWGLRLNFRPGPNLEIGLQRTAMLGGRGRPDDIDTWLRSFLVLSEHESGEAGDQRAGYDIKLTLPFKVQPFQVYTEGAAEDSVGLRPVQWAYIYGIYLPRVLSFERLELRYEWAGTYEKGEPSVWYRHHIYTDGYTYKDRVIGHHMGTNSRDNFMEMTYRIPEKDLRVWVSYDIEEHNISNPVREKKDETIVGLSVGFKSGIRLNLVYGYARIKNPGNVVADTLKVNTVESSLAVRF